jgi:hypothetical protein
MIAARAASGDLMAGDSNPHMIQGMVGGRRKRALQRHVIRRVRIPIGFSMAGPGFICEIPGGYALPRRGSSKSRNAPLRADGA